MHTVRYQHQVVLQSALWRRGRTSPVMGEWFGWKTPTWNREGGGAGSGLLEQHMKSKVQRTKRVTVDRAVSTDARTAECSKVWNAGKDFVTHAVESPHARNEYAVLILHNSSDPFWGLVLEDFSHEALGLLNGVRWRSQRR